MEKLCKCEQCGKEFELRDSDISFYQSKGLEPPKVCADCRKKNSAKSARRKRIPIKEILSLMGIVLFLIIIASIYGAINHNNPYSSVGKETTTSAAEAPETAEMQ